MNGKFRYFKEILTPCYGEKEAEKLVITLFEDLLNIKRTDIFISSHDLNDQETSIIVRAVNLLLQYVPVQYITGKTLFYGNFFKVDKRVLIPRPETEELIQLIIKQTQQSIKHILDIGTGSGCIAITLHDFFPDSKITATDASTEAIELAIDNAGARKINFLVNDILLESSRKQLNNTYDIIVSNPPYIPVSYKNILSANVLHYEPHIALFVPDNDPLIFYKVIAEFAWQNLSKNGKIYFEIFEDFSKEVLEILRNIGYNNISCLQDINGKNRMIAAIKS